MTAQHIQQSINKVSDIIGSILKRRDPKTNQPPPLSKKVCDAALPGQMARNWSVTCHRPLEEGGHPPRRVGFCGRRWRTVTPL